MRLSTILFAVLAIPLVAAAQSNQGYQCTMGELVRRVVIERDGAAPVPCEVAYYKDTEAPGERRVLWSAQNDPAYCDARSSEFLSELRGWGWQCTAINAGGETARDEDSPQ